eukprot:g2144.t1
MPKGALSSQLRHSNTSRQLAGGKNVRLPPLSHARTAGRNLGNASFVKGDRVKVVKHGHHYLEEATVLDPNWSGRVKVNMTGQYGEVLSYLPFELKKIARHARQSAKNRAGAKEASIFVVFMCFYCPLTMRGLYDSDIYTFTENLRGQLETVEMLPEHSPTWGKTFRDVATVEEYYHWLLGGFAHTVFSPSTFDGDPDWTFDGGSQGGYTLGYGKLLGAVRIGQVRGKQRDCSDALPPSLRDGQQIYCYGGSGTGYALGDKRFDVDLEDVADFGELVYHRYLPSGAVPWVSNSSDPSADPPFAPTKFYFDGLFASTRGRKPVGSVADERARYMSSFTTTTWNTYPAPGFTVNFDPLMGKEAASQLIKDLKESHYIDLQTKALFVDINVYNAMLRKLCYVRLVAEMTDAGGVRTSSKYETFTPWKSYSVEDFVYDGLLVVVFLFYVHYAFEEWRKYRIYLRAASDKSERYAARRQYFFENTLQLSNIVFFMIATTFKIASYSLLPSSVEVSGEHYNDFRPATTFRDYMVVVQATNVFLNWFKLVAILNFSPSFGIMTSTLVRAGQGVSGFAVVFFIVLFGFA